MVPFYEIQRSDIKIIHNKRELNYPTHVHEHMEILYIFDLSQHINIDGIDYEINAGEAAIIFPNTIHTYYREVYRDTDEICLLFLPGIFKGLFQNFFDVQPESPVITDIDSSVKLAFKELLSCTDFTEQVAWTMLIFSKLIKKLNLTHKQSIPVAGLTKKIINLYFS